MDTLFDLNASTSANDTSFDASVRTDMAAPLAVRMRPRNLDEYAGQTQAVGEHSWLRRAIEHDTVTSIILYGPSGTGKTTLAHIIALYARARCYDERY